MYSVCSEGVSVSHAEMAVQQTAGKGGPRTLFARLGALEAFTWAGLLVGMFLKYVTETTELAVRIFGGLHGFVFLAYCVMAVLVGIDSRWKLARHAAALEIGRASCRERVCQYV